MPAGPRARAVVGRARAAVGAVGRGGAGQAELRTAEELCLEALARDVDAVELDRPRACVHADKFRRDLFWLMCGLRPQRPGITLLVHSPDRRSGDRGMGEARARRGRRARLARQRAHLERRSAGLEASVGPRRAIDRGAHGSGAVAPAALVRVAGSGAETLLGLEAGLHKFVGLARRAVPRLGRSDRAEDRLHRLRVGCAAGPADAAQPRAVSRCARSPSAPIASRCSATRSCRRGASCRSDSPRPRARACSSASSIRATSAGTTATRSGSTRARSHSSPRPEAVK